uniref:NADH-ubiquinone oxidoreductase chain 2 n=1 Tax=Nosodendron fasciculare TaxID=295673 RepID=A0A343C3B4_9COLE|nr:NADH dehydrogenase subunit 2 [Nosodendron fasciculare]
MLFILTMIISTLISISSNSWMGMWMGMEINLLSIIPLMNNSKNILATEASIKYFITQALASTILLFAVIIMSMNLDFQFKDMSMTLIINSSLLTKMGMAPFHFWFPEVMQGMNWTNSLILLTWQKITPMTIIMYNMKYMQFFMIIIIISMIISSIMSMNQTSLRKILTYSSINHMSWMISSIFFIESNWTLYFSVYSLITTMIIMMFKYLNVYYMKQLINSLNNNPFLKIMFILNFLSLSGLPPFLGFLPKWIAIQALVFNDMNFIIMNMVILTLIMMFIYLRMSFSTMMILTNKLNYNYFNKWNNSMIMMLNFLTLMSFIMFTLMLNFI